MRQGLPLMYANTVFQAQDYNIERMQRYTPGSWHRVCSRGRGGPSCHHLPSTTGGCAHGAFHPSRLRLMEEQQQRIRVHKEYVRGHCPYPSPCRHVASSDRDEQEGFRGIHVLQGVHASTLHHIPAQIQAHHTREILYTCVNNPSSL